MENYNALREALIIKQKGEEPLAHAILKILKTKDPDLYSEIVDEFTAHMDNLTDEMIRIVKD